MNNMLQNLEDEIIKNYNSINISFHSLDGADGDYWQYECNRRVKLSLECSVGSLLCYSVKGKTREEACNKLYNAIKRDDEDSKRLIEQYKKMKEIK